MPDRPSAALPIHSLSHDRLIHIRTDFVQRMQQKGSVLRDISGSHRVGLIGSLTYARRRFQRCYLSQDTAFLHLAIDPATPERALECRLFECRRIYELSDTAEAPESTRAFWLSCDPDPDISGRIGCLMMRGTVFDPAAGNCIYRRTWIPTITRIRPVPVMEAIVDSAGQHTARYHLMMQYGRILEGDGSAEYLLISLAEDSAGARVAVWVGTDIASTDLVLCG